MRSLSANAQALIQQKRGLEPINIVEVDWGLFGGSSRYCDKTIEGLYGRILGISPLDYVIDLSGSSSSQEISIVLDDTDGQIKGILDQHDVHQRDVRVYQWFAGMEYSDRFLVFTGKISSPIQWSEAERTFSFRAVTQLEDGEIGFSAEQGNFSAVPEELVDRTWPIVFGTVLDLPTVPLPGDSRQLISGETACGVGVLSGLDYMEGAPISGDECGVKLSLAMMSQQISFLNVTSSYWRWADPQRSADLFDQANEVRKQFYETANQYKAQRACASAQRFAQISELKGQGEGCNPVKILGGEDFPQGKPITVKIDTAEFTGVMVGDLFYISSRTNPTGNQIAAAQNQKMINSQCRGQGGNPPQAFDFSMEVPEDTSVTPGGVYRRNGWVSCNEPARLTPPNEPLAHHFWAEPGARVELKTGYPPRFFIASITPVTILECKAYYHTQGTKELRRLPSEEWYAGTKSFGDITAYGVWVKRPLKEISENWDDSEIYVTVRSTIGPNTVDIIEYIIDQWTKLNTDATSFAHVRAKLESFPSNFPVFDRPEALSLVKDIAFQARCAVWVKGDTVYLKYLPEECASDMTVTLSDIAAKSISVETTSTEELVTKMNITYKRSHAEDDKHIVLRHNIHKYGVKARDYNWFIYNNPQLVQHAATFWLVRFANTWKRMRFKGFVNLLALETFDTITLDQGAEQYVASSSVKALVENATYDSDSNTIDFEVLTPVKFGQAVEYPFFWPSAAPAGLRFPTPAEVAELNAAGGNVSSLVTVESLFEDDSYLTELPSRTESDIWVGGANLIYPGRSDQGSQYPGDIGFTSTNTAPASYYQGYSTSAKPELDLNLKYIAKPGMTPLSGNPAAPTIIDIRSTKIVDSDVKGAHATLDSIIKKINNDGRLVIDVAAKYGDESQEAEFDFKYDSDGEKYGAGTAFLQDE